MIIAIDTETTGVGWHDQAFMISVTDGDETHVFDKRETSGLEFPKALMFVYTLIEKADKVIMHNAKFDLQKLHALGFDVSMFANKFEDTQALAHLLDEHQSTSLKYLARTYLNEETDEDEVLKAYRRKAKLKKEDGYEPIPNEILAPYAAKDAEFTLRLYKFLQPKLPQDLYELYELEKRLTLVLLSVERQGMQVDREYVINQRKEYGDRIFKLKRRIGELAGEEFNPQSHQQVLHALNERGLVVSSTSKDALKQVDDELAGLILELRECNKIKATYFDALHNEAQDSILHPNFRQHGTRTGRMSSGAAVA